ncbi:3'-5' DNA helicase [Recurvomyces mirabilis]|uniref:ATP-dependent DNA helicase n=1 Tax=Recurvomyces mirabilis TaxID=574656 RepID=A0AAE1C2N1_9PEZI|nr:3'-5' DNA helicase [Recurvomyces mirabilis]KAK5155991.1 3'-5' DNA helicase [Recurvomyces mirabilis]
MPHSDDFGIDDDDTEFLAVATQVEASPHGGKFEPSGRPMKRRRILHTGAQVDAADSDGAEALEIGDEEDGRAVPSNFFRSTAAFTQDGAADADEADPEGYYFPEELGEKPQAPKNAKYKIHIPRNGGQLPDTIFTQTQAHLDSSPSRIRGAVWKKPKPPPPPLFSHGGKSTLASVSSSQGPSMPLVRQQTTLRNHFRRDDRTGLGVQMDDDAALAARMQAEEDGLAEDLGIARRTTAPVVPTTSMEMHKELADLPADAFSSSSPEKSPPNPIIDISSSQPAAAQASRLRGPQTGLKQMTIFGQPATQEISTSQAATKRHAWPLKEREEPPTHHKLDEDAMKTWVYPTNLGTIRDYQYNIVSRSLFHNTLVALPTGLGKTFIAATVMLNYYRWTTKAQIVFMAPTKPLIAQQLGACFHIVGISRHDTVLMTGETTPGARAEEWLEKRLFFMTPQTVINDLKTGICDPKKVVLVVVDEAHKATGSYAYTEVITFLRRFNSSFRVLALTATPGSTVEAVQAVIDHLGIARVELRTEQSLDIRPYTHEKQTDVELFDYSDEQALIMEHMSKAIKPALQKLNAQNAYWSKDPMALSAFGLTQSRQKWMQSDPGRKAPMSLKGMVNSIFTVLSQVAHGIGLLKNHGIGPFYSTVSKFKRAVDSGETKGKNAKEIVQSVDFTQMMSRMNDWMKDPDFIGHPKLEYLREVVLNHFLDAGEGALGSNAPPSATRVMVFASYRDSTEEICRVLKRSEPMIRPHVFVGQAGSATSEGMSQKKQNEVIQQFKAGKFNTLVATSIGEEGLDIGDVDLIVCYDASSSPIRMLQRIGRTGRKRVGKVVLLLMKGKEENDYAKAQDNYQYIQKSIADESKYNYRNDQSPRIIPKEVKPVVDRRVIEIPIENSQPVDLNEKSRKSKGKAKKRPPKKFHMPDGVRTGFVKASKLASDDEDGASDKPVSKTKNTPAKKSVPTRRAKPAPSPEPDPMQLPFLGDVLLTDARQAELEGRYGNAANDEDVAIRAPDATKRIDLIRDLGRTKYVPHGRAALATSKALAALHAVNDEKVQQMKADLDTTILSNPGVARRRLVSPNRGENDSELDLPEPKDITEEPKVKKLPAKRASAIRPKDATAQGAATAKTPRGRPRKNKAIHRVWSHGSAAMEGEESEPEPTPTDMRIGTQGIDLGSHDTSGEDNDDEPDSELDAFIARSDEIIETLSSSLPGTQETSQLSHQKKAGRLRRRPAVVLSDLDEDDEADASEDDGADGAAKDLVGARKQRVVAESDSE